MNLSIMEIDDLETLEFFESNNKLPEFYNLEN